MPFWLRRQEKGSEGQRSDPPPRPVAQVSKYGFKVLYEPDEPELANIDIVFIHGLDGHRERSWMADGAELSWPQSLLPQKLPQARILTFGYDARYVGWGPVSTNLLPNHATTMLHALVHQRDQDNTHDRPLLFVAHSLGGLVCADALVSSSNSPEDLKHLRTISDCTRGIAFLGTPHAGSALATWAQLLRRSITAFKQTNKDILAVLGQDSKMLQEVRNSFDAMIQARAKDEKRAIAITCFYEELPVIGLGREIVSKASAQLRGYPSIGIHANHMDMTKFKSENDPGFLEVSGELRRWMKDFCKLSGGLSTIPFQLNPAFVGRKDVLRDIDEKMKSKSSPKRRVALYGLGGIGKTQILVQYGYKRCQSALSTSVFWVSASSCASFQKSYEDIANKLDLLNGQGDAHTDVLLLVKETLESKGLGEWIMIVDNADDLPHLFVDHPDGRKDLLSYLPEDSPNSILYSSRTKTVACQLAAQGGIIFVEALNPEDSKSLLSEKLRAAGMASAPGEGWSQLLAELGYLPLAIVQAASYMIAHSWTVATCLSHYRADKSLHMLKHEFRDTTREEQGFSDEQMDQRPTNAVSSMFTTIFLQIQSQDPYAAEILCLMAVYVNVITSTPKEMFQETEGVEHDVRFAKSIGTLLGFSLVSTKDDGKSFLVHHLFQLSLRDWLGCHDQYRPWTYRAITLLDKHFPSRIDSDQDEVKIAQLNLHMPIPPYTNLEENPPGSEKDAVCSLFIKSSAYFASIENITACMAWAQFVWEFSGLFMVEDKLAAANADLVKAKALFLKGEYGSAQEFCQTALNDYAKMLGAREVLTHDAMHLMGSIAHARGKYKEAYFIHKEVVDLSQAAFGLDRTYELGRISSMALSYAAHTYDLNQWFDPTFEEDRSLEEVLQWTREHKGAESRAARLAMTDLATSLLRGNIERAWELNEGALKLKGEPLYPADPHTRENLRIRALVLYGQNKNAEAERWARVVLESSEKALGAKHPKTLDHAWTLALILIAQRKWAQSEEFASRAYEGYTELYGPEDMFTTDSRLLVEVALRYQYKRQLGYHWVQMAPGLWTKRQYTPKDFPGRQYRLWVALELPYELRRYDLRQVEELKPEHLEAWRNYSLIHRLPRRHFPEYIRATLFEDIILSSLVEEGMWESETGVLGGNLRARPALVSSND